MSRKGWSIWMSAAALTTQACAHYRIAPQRTAGEGARTGAAALARAEAWDATSACKSESRPSAADGAYLAKVSQSFGNGLVTVVTLGISSGGSSRLEFDCGEPCTGRTMKATKGGSATVISYLWGALEAEPPVDCKHAYVSEVTVKSNWGQRLVRALTLGAVASSTIEWKCAAPCDEAAQPLPTLP